MDELIQFAAGKLKIPIQQWNGRWIMPLMNDKSWIEITGEKYQNFNLTSWDLFGQGLAACPYEVDINRYDQIGGIGCIELWDRGPDRATRKRIPHSNDIPVVFWQCWQDLEKQL